MKQYTLGEVLTIIKLHVEDQLPLGQVAKIVGRSENNIFFHVFAPPIICGDQITHKSYIRLSPQELFGSFGETYTGQKAVNYHISRFINGLEK